MSVSVKIKPLEWTAVTASDRKAEKADTIFGTWEIWQFPNGGGVHIMKPGQHQGMIFEDSYDEAKAHLERAYRLRLAPALESSGQSAEIARLREALADLTKAVHSRPDETWVRDGRAVAKWGRDDLRPALLKADAALAGQTADPLPAIMPVDEPQPLKWRPMKEAPTNGKHVILAVKANGGFVYSVEGAFLDGKWMNAADINSEPLCWMPKVMLPDEFKPWIEKGGA